MPHLFERWRKVARLGLFLTVLHWHHLPFPCHSSPWCPIFCSFSPRPIPTDLWPCNVFRAAITHVCSRRAILISHGHKPIIKAIIHGQLLSPSGSIQTSSDLGPGPVDPGSHHVSVVPSGSFKPRDHMHVHPNHSETRSRGTESCRKRCVSLTFYGENVVSWMSSVTGLYSLHSAWKTVHSFGSK